MDPIWGMLKASLLGVLWLKTDVYTPSKVAKPVPTSDLILVCWGYFEVEYFHSDFIVVLVVMVKFISVDEMCFFSRCGKSD